MWLNNLWNEQSYKISAFDKNLINSMSENDKDLLLNSLHIEVTKFVQAKKWWKIMRDLYREIQVKDNDFLYIFEKSVWALKDNWINRDFLAPYREKYKENLEKQKEEEKKFENIRKKSEEFFETSKEKLNKFDSEFRNLQNELFLNNDFEKLAKITRLKDLFLRNETLVKNFLVDKNPDFIEEFCKNVEEIFVWYKEMLDWKLIIVYIMKTYPLVKIISDNNWKILNKFFKVIEKRFNEKKAEKNSKNTEKPKERIEKIKIWNNEYFAYYDENWNIYKMRNSDKVAWVFIEIEGKFEKDWKLIEWKKFQVNPDWTRVFLENISWKNENKENLKNENIKKFVSENLKLFSEVDKSFRWLKKHYSGLNLWEEMWIIYKMSWLFAETNRILKSWNILKKDEVLFKDFLNSVNRYSKVIYNDKHILKYSQNLKEIIKNLQ